MPKSAGSGSVNCALVMPETIRSRLEKAGLELDERFHPPLKAHTNFANNEHREKIMAFAIRPPELSQPPKAEVQLLLPKGSYKLRLGKPEPGQTKAFIDAVEYTLGKPIANQGKINAARMVTWAWHALKNGKQVIFVDNEIDPSLHVKNLTPNQISLYKSILPKKKSK